MPLPNAPSNADPAEAEYPRTYQVTTSWQVISTGLGMLIGIPAIFGTWYFATGHAARGEVSAVVSMLLCFSFVMLAGYLIADAFASKILLHEDAIEVVHLFGERRLKRDEIAQQRMRRPRYGPRVLDLLATSPKLRKIEIPRIYATDAVLESWLAQIPARESSE